MSVVNLIALEETGSTNLAALDAARAGAPHLTLITAKRQVAGRGRGDRVWQSPEGNLFWSLVLRPQPHWGDISELPYVAALALHDLVRGYIAPPTSVTLKWPNDVLIDGAKVSGTLIESNGVARGPAGKLTAEAVVVGIGLNIVAHPSENMLYAATHLNAHNAHADAARVRDELAENFIAILALWEAQGFAPIRARYLSAAHGLGQTILVSADGPAAPKIEGVYRGLDESGQLLLDLPNGARRLISAGDVFFPV